jgi:AraC-like DNA-binding protein
MLGDSLQFRDSEHLSSVLQHTDVSAVQLSRGKFHADLALRSFGGWTLQYISFHEGTSSAAGTAARQRRAFLIPLSVNSPCRVLGEEFTPDRMVIYAPGGEHADVTTAGLSEVVVTPPAGVLDEAADRGEQIRLIRSGSMVATIPQVELGTLKQVLRHCRSLSAPSVASSALERSVADVLELALVGALRSSTEIQAPGRLPLPRTAILARVRHALERNHADPLFATELARLAGVSYPTLRRIFLEWFGVSPVRYLFLKRLYLARQKILSGECQTVTEAATICGFWELGRFSKRYAEAFGELPSVTLARANGATKPDRQGLAD